MPHTLAWALLLRDICFKRSRKGSAELTDDKMNYDNLVSPCSGTKSAQTDIHIILNLYKKRNIRALYLNLKWPNVGKSKYSEYKLLKNCLTSAGSQLKVMNTHLPKLKKHISPSTKYRWKFLLGSQQAVAPQPVNSSSESSNFLFKRGVFSPLSSESAILNLYERSHPMINTWPLPPQVHQPSENWAFCSLVPTPLLHSFPDFARPRGKREHMGTRLGRWNIY